MNIDDLFMFICLMAIIVGSTKVLLKMLQVREARHLARAGATAGTGDQRTVNLLTSENDRLAGKVERLEERISVLERIATDKSGRLAEQIEALR